MSERELERESEREREIVKEREIVRGRERETNMLNRDTERGQRT